jgi:hypothetical protein
LKDNGSIFKWRQKIILEEALQIARKVLPEAGIQAVDYENKLAATRWPEEPTSPSLPRTDEAELDRWLNDVRSRHPEPKKDVE